jgi:RHS repeat-associated protein
MNADDHGQLLQRVSAFSYGPRDRLASVTRTDPDTDEQVGSETYTHDANNNIISQTINGVTTDSVYDRNRLHTTTAAGVTSSYNYDPFGRLDTVTLAGQVSQRYVYDGFDRVVEHRTDTAVTAKVYDPLDRVLTKTVEEGTDERTTSFAYLGLSDQVLAEFVDGQLETSYQHGLDGHLLSQTKHDQQGPAEDSYYAYNPHGDVAAITDETGDARATYGYTAYGSDDEDLFTGVDRPGPGDPTVQEPYNAYRYSGERWDAHSGTYDMGFRDYNPGLNRFLTRDTFNGALADMHLGTNPWNMSRYSFAGGNPISRIELHGHIATCTPDGNNFCPDYDVGAQGVRAGSSAGQSSTVPDDAWGDPCIEHPNSDYCLALEFIVDEMAQNSVGSEVGSIRFLLEPPPCLAEILGLCIQNSNGPDLPAAAAQWAGLVCQDYCKWDHKPQIREMFGMDLNDLDSLMFDIPDTDLRINYDVWSNIHYGYVGSAAGFGPDTLHVVDHLPGNPLSGRQDESDHLYAQLGIDLYVRYSDAPDEITTGAVHLALMSLINGHGGPGGTLRNERQVLPRRR